MFVCYSYCYPFVSSTIVNIHTDIQLKTTLIHAAERFSDY